MSVCFLRSLKNSKCVTTAFTLTFLGTNRHKLDDLVSAWRKDKVEKTVNVKIVFKNLCMFLL